MNCEKIAELLPDFLRGGLERERAEMVEQHLERCAECRDDVDVWQKLALLPAPEAVADSRARFDAVLQAYQAGRAQPEFPASTAGEKAPRRKVFDWLRTPAAALAWSIALLAIGFFAGNGMSRTTSHSEDLAVMRSELSSMRQLVVLSMLQQQSASERLQGVSYSQREAQLDPQVLAALLHTLRHDSNVDVRLAALDALSRHSGQPQVRRGVTDALQNQQSPLVQVALIDQLLEWRDPDLAQRLRDLQRTPDLNPVVRERAEWAINKIQ
ncbi:MAG TPA: zf-HC2 domain-containing protein [Candidatus Binatia bacterium]|nr:zf-HC2 domain-containing protein [Candidatus Binatia bacterium]